MRRESILREPAMYLRKFLFAVTSFILLVTLTAAASGPAWAQSDKTIEREFSIGEDPKRFFYTLREFDDSIPDEEIERAQVQLADWVQRYWMQYEAAGFKAPAVIEDGVETLRFIHTNKPCCSGNFGGLSSELNVRGPLPGVDTDTDLQLQNVIVHEMFHFLQHRYDNFDEYPANLEEGTAKYVPELLDPGMRDQILDDDRNCNWIYLAGSRGSVFFRPGGGPWEDNVCGAALFFKYLSQQFASENPDPRAGELDALRRLHESLEYFGGWRSRRLDDLAFAADFNGDDVDDLFVRSDRYMGLVSRPFWEPRTWDVKGHGGRIGSGWRFYRTDRTPATCDFVGDSKQDLLIVSSSHVGVLEFDHEGRFRSGPITHRSALGTGGAWVDLARAEFLAGDFDGDSKCEVLMKHSGGLTLLDVSRTRLTPIMNVAPNSRLGGGWRHRSIDELVAAGDFDDDGRDEFLLSNSQYIGAGGLNASGTDFVTEAANIASYRLPGSSVPVGISRGDRIFTGRFAGDYKDVIAKVGGDGILFFSLRERGFGFQLEGSRSQPVMRGSSLIAADLTGDGRDVLVERNGAGIVQAIRPAIGGGVQATTLLESGEVLTDGENGGDSSRRNPFTIMANLEFEASGDFNGDGTDDLAVRSGRIRQILYSRIEGGVPRFTIDKPIFDGERYYGLAAGIDRFIRANSGSGSDARTLRSVFNDFAVANLLTRSRDAGPRHRYAELDDTEDMTYHATLGRDSASAPLEQDPWAISYTEIKSDAGAGRVTVRARASKPQLTSRFHLFVLEGNRVVGRFSGGGSVFSQTVAMNSRQRAVLVAVSFEAPLAFEVSATP